MSELIVDEHPQIIALIISYLDFSMGADVLNLLPDDLQQKLSPYCNRNGSTGRVDET